MTWLMELWWVSYVEETLINNLINGKQSNVENNLKSILLFNEEYIILKLKNNNVYCTIMRSVIWQRIIKIDVMIVSM